MKILNSILVLVMVFGFALPALAQDKGLLIDDFEGRIFGGPEGTVDFGAGSGSSVEVAAATDIRYSGKQSLKITYDAVSGGYIWVARGFGLDAKNAAWLIILEDIDWQKFTGIAFYMYGGNSQARIAFDIKDNGNEIWRFMVEDNFKGWKEIICTFSGFFARGDWQPGNADKNTVLNFPIKSFQFEPLPVSKGMVYFDRVELINK